MDRHALDAAVAGRNWHHRIDLGGGLVTPGGSEPVLSPADFPVLEGRTVLDIGAWDGYYSFLAERAGASRVVALDHYVWGVDMARRNVYWAECTARGEMPDHRRDLDDFWEPDLPGKGGFDLARELLGSQVESVVGDIATMDLEPLGTFDVVLFLGVLYHLPDPLHALERVRRLTDEVAVIETEAMHVPAHEAEPLIEFTAGQLAARDYGNWFTPTVPALIQMCLAVGFSRVEVVKDRPAEPSPHAATRHRRWPGSRAPVAPPAPRHFRAAVHAFA